uniref:Uncharacterized protein n=1 Tax=Arundo donax TaxID=35708 RepID=A0A0A9GFB5_ARUDO
MTPRRPSASWCCCGGRGTCPPRPWCRRSWTPSIHLRCCGFSLPDLQMPRGKRYGQRSQQLQDA